MMYGMLTFLLLLPYCLREKKEEPSRNRRRSLSREETTKEQTSRILRDAFMVGAALTVLWKPR